ncbi:TlpA family protein disulfide reductase [Evansella halocellulosilytica]|uniref:TlpA family protein disulfide reductase n=1 Tax=Evansella halocellulosilytica TaxID=2011013 RepID=UPI0015CB1ED9|nr:TlpA disulfide reductase family protein [Evansella halocellulosilytica]
MSAPNFQLPYLDTGGESSLNDYDGKAVLLTFWVSWCPDSQRDLALKEQFFKSMDTDALEIMMINVTGREAEADAGKKYYEKNHFTFPCLSDHGTTIYDRYQCMSVPTTFLLDPNHNIVARFNDKATFREIIAAIGQVMND